MPGQHCWCMLFRLLTHHCCRWLSLCSAGRPVSVVHNQGGQQCSGAAWQSAGGVSMLVVAAAAAAGIVAVVAATCGDDLLIN